MDFAQQIQDLFQRGWTDEQIAEHFEASDALADFVQLARKLATGEIKMEVFQ